MSARTCAGIATTTTTSTSTSSTSSSSPIVVAPRTPRAPTFFHRRQRQSRQKHHHLLLLHSPPHALPTISADVAALVAFSALPFLGVQALADSGAGKRLKGDLEKRKPALSRAAAEAERLRAGAARRETRYYGPERGKWLPRSLWGTSLIASYLPGEAPGDCAFDPLKLCARYDDDDRGDGRNKTKKRKNSSNISNNNSKSTTLTLSRDRFDKYFELELLHARWAMLGAFGALVPEALSLSGFATFAEDRWWNVGRAKLSGEDLNYLGISGAVVAGKQGVAIIALTQALLMSGPEIARATGVEALEPLGIYLGGDKNWPGGVLFDPLGLASGGGGRGSGRGGSDEERKAEAAVRLRVAEVKHGRLAMVAWLGFAAQALVGRQGPLQDLVDLFL